MPHNLIKTPLASNGVRLDSLLAGVHLPGCCSLLPGICELAEEVFGITALRGRLHGVAGSAGDLGKPGIDCIVGIINLPALAP